MLKCHVGAANQADVKAAPWVLFEVIETYERWAKILADQGYRGDVAVDLAEVYGVDFEIVEHQGQGFSVQPKHWVVETQLGVARKLSRINTRLRTIARESCGDGVRCDDSIDAATTRQQSQKAEEKNSLIFIYKHSLISDLRLL